MYDQLDKYRGEYVTHLRRVIARVRNEHEKVASELWLELSSEALHKNFYRIDVISNGEDTKTVEANIDLPSGDPILAQYQDVDLRIEPFAWNNVMAFASGVSVSNDDLDFWFRHWFDEEEVFVEDETGLSGVIHSLSVDNHRSGVAIGVDLGSAPVDALFQLLDLLVDLDPHSVCVSSPHAES